MPPKKSVAQSVMSMVNETIPKTKSKAKRVEKTEEEIKQIIPKAMDFVSKMIEAKKAKKAERTLDLDIGIAEPVTPPQISNPVDIPTPPTKVKKEQKITQRVIHEEDDSEPEIIEEIIMKKKKKKPIIRRRIIYESSSEEEEEEEVVPKPRRSGKGNRVADPVNSMTQSQINNDLRRIQMEMLSKSLFG